MALKKSQRSLRTWTKQKWRTASGKKSSETGEVYAPENLQQLIEKKEKLQEKVNNTQNMVYIKVKVNVINNAKQRIH